MDPDGDGRINLWEYALGTDPNLPDSATGPAFSFVNVSGTNYGAMTYTRVKAATDIGYSVAVTADVGTPVWTPLTNVVSTVDQGDTEAVTVRDNVPANLAPARFYQLQILAPY